VVHLNDKIGKEGGYVVDILKNTILVRLPDTDEPVALSLAPETLPESYGSSQ